MSSLRSQSALLVRAHQVLGLDAVKLRIQRKKGGHMARVVWQSLAVSGDIVPHGQDHPSIAAILHET